MKHLNKNETKALKYLKDQLKNKLGDSFLGLKIYGSKARGDYHKESDIDIIIVTESKNDYIEDKIFNVIGDVLLKYETYFSAVIYTKKGIEEMEKSPTFFYQTIKKDLVNA